ncbi:MAG: hypothetical protein HYS86_00585 [Candidatus Chisholmbacteria bacterium]|nr:hypothetical protein [Candidatus Chisholmbacteria bacterium]
MGSPQEIPTIIPSKFQVAWQRQEIREAIHIKAVAGIVNPEYELPDCPHCLLPLVYAEGPHHDLNGDVILVVDAIMAYRCLNEVCKRFNEVQAFLPEVIAELKQVIRETPAIALPAPTTDGAET